MIYVATLALGLLFAFNVRAGRGFLYPASLFAGIWFVSLVGLVAAGEALYEVSADTLAVYVLGVMVFSLGCLASTRIRPRASCTGASRSPPRCQPSSPTSRVLLDVALALVALALPYYLKSVAAGGDWSDPLYFALQRAAAIEARSSSERSFSLVANLVNLATFVALAMHYEADGTLPRRARAFAAIALAVMYGAATGTKGNVVALMLSLALVSAVRAGRLGVKQMGVGAGSAAVLFGVGLAMVNYAYMGLRLSWESVAFIARTIRLYWLGGVVAFDRVVHAPHSLEAVQGPERFILETANGFGARFHVPSSHAAYTSVSATDQVNTYTLYFTYLPEYGVAGVCVGALLYGVVVGWVFRLAKNGRPIASIMYASLATGLVLSVLADRFLLGLNGHIKLLMLLGLVYWVVPKIRSRRFRGAVGA